MTVQRTRTAPAPGRLSAAAAEAWIPRTCFKHGPPARVGVELELLVHDRRHRRLPTDGPAFDPLRRALASADVDGRVTLEPGGQVELSSAVHDDLPGALAAVRADLEHLRGVARDGGAELAGRGLDDRRVRRRVLRDPRYAGMEAYLDRWGPAGRLMMRRTASVQVNLEASDGTPHDRDRRWRVLHAVGPALVAAFANSPGPAGTPWAGWPCARMGVWLTLDPARTGEPRARPGESLDDAWARWCLDAPLMLVRRRDGPWTAPPGTFRDWLEAGERLVPDRPAPGVDDLAYHLTTLFPPVRPRGHLEVRYVDAQPGDWWQVPVAVLWALATDPAAGERAASACAGDRGRWLDAARHGLHDASLARSARAVLQVAATALDAAPSTRPSAALVRAYLHRWTARGRCPADDAVDGAVDGAAQDRPDRPDREEMPC